MYHICYHTYQYIPYIYMPHLHIYIYVLNFVSNFNFRNIPISVLCHFTLNYKNNYKSSKSLTHLACQSGFICYPQTTTDCNFNKLQLGNSLIINLIFSISTCFMASKTNVKQVILSKNLIQF